MASASRQYDCDVTYGTNNELGFDYLRDNMKYRIEDMVQRGHVYAIVDEVDSILIDEARTPLIISGPLDDRSDFYNTIDTFIPRLDKGDYEVDEKQRTVTLTELGMERLEQGLREANLLKSESLYDVENVSVVHHVNQGLRAHKLFQRDKDYIVRNGEVVIIDEFTGRMMPAGELVDDDDLAVAHDVVLVALEQLMRAQRLVDVVHDGDVLDVVEQLGLEQPGVAQPLLQLLHAELGERDRALLLVDLVVALVELAG